MRKRGEGAGRLGWVLPVVLAWILTGCGALPLGGTPTPSALSVAAEPKRLATVAISPTPDDAAQQATRLASSPTPNPFATEIPTQTPTVYVGLFLGGSGAQAPAMGSGFGGTPTATSNVRCAIPPDVGTFGEGWQNSAVVSRGLGCPVEGTVPFRGVAQVFENGGMYLQPDGQSWAVEAGLPGQYWVLQNAPGGDVPDVNPPPGLLPPAPEFSVMWAGVEGVQAALGFAQVDAAEANLAFQRYEGGTLLWDGGSGQTFALLLDNTVYGPF